MDTLAFPFSFKSIDDGGVIEGIAAGFGNRDSYGDVIAPGAFAKSLARIAAGGRGLPMLYQYDLKRPIGVWNHLREVSDGLEARGRLTLAAPDAQAAHALARDGALTGISIGYVVPQGGETPDGKGGAILREINLMEASLVTIPANDKARVSRVKNIANIRDLEDLLRDEGGMSGRRAKAAATAAWKAINASDSDEEANAELTEVLRQSAARIAAF
jgi:HK97 family phage prohead protease